MLKDYAVSLLVVPGCILGGVVAYFYAKEIMAMEIAPPPNAESSSLVNDQEEPADMYDRIKRISGFIREGADAFLAAEYRILTFFVVGFSIFLFSVLAGFNKTNRWKLAGFSTISFLIGAISSIVSGFIGMRIAVTANSRTAIQAKVGYQPAFNTAFKAGMVMGFGLVALGIIVLYILAEVYRISAFKGWHRDPEVCHLLFEALSGYGLGGSAIALFGRVGGGIYTKAADVGADLSGKVIEDFPEDDPRNPAVIADNVGDNVGDIAGMGADLFGSLAEGSCATMVIAAQSSLYNNWGALNLPLIILSVGIIVSWLTSFVALTIKPVRQESEIEPALKLQLLVSTILMTLALIPIVLVVLPKQFMVAGFGRIIRNWHILICVVIGLWSGLAIGYITEYYTSYTYKPVRELADACSTGAATNVIYGLALGYKSCIIPVFCLAATIAISHSLAQMYGVASAALGILSTLATGLTIDAYGPICDNAGGIAEMCHMPSYTRERTDNLDSAGNTTAAIGKGFAIGSAALVSLALFGAFVTTSKLATVDLLKPFPFTGLLLGAMIPYWFSALTMKSVGDAAHSMVKEVERQLDINSDSGRLIRQQKQDPDYAACIKISTEASLREMIAPGCLVIITPIAIGFLLGVECLAGFLAGNLVSGVQIAISASNTGGAFDNCKKYLGGPVGLDKKSEQFKASVIGDTVGDPLKDTSGPSINILIKLSAIIAVVFAKAFPDPAKGGYLIQLYKKISKQKI